MTCLFYFRKIKFKFPVEIEVKPWGFLLASAPSIMKRLDVRKMSYFASIIPEQSNYLTLSYVKKLEALWAEAVSLTFHSALRKLNTEPPIGASHQVLVIWLNSYKEEDI